MSHQVIVQPLDLFYWNTSWDILAPGFPIFFSNWTYGIKFNPFPTPGRTLADTQQLVQQAGSTPPFETPRGQDVVDALLTNGVDITWILNGLDWSQSSKAAVEKLLNELAVALTNNKSKFLSPSYFPKGIMGYSGGCVGLLVLEALGLCGGIHGPLMAQIATGQVDKTVQQRIDQVFTPFKTQSTNPVVYNLSTVTAENSFAKNILNGTNSLSGYVWGGMIDFVDAILSQGLFTIQNAIVFIEGIKLGDEDQLAAQLFSLLTNGKNIIRAFMLGWWWNQDIVQQYKAKVIEIANQNGVAVFSGLKAGHVPSGESITLNYPVPFGPGVMTGDGTTVTVTYDVGAYLNLLQQRRNNLSNLTELLKTFKVPSSLLSLSNPDI